MTCTVWFGKPADSMTTIPAMCSCFRPQRLRSTRTTKGPTRRLSHEPSSPNTSRKTRWPEWHLASLERGCASGQLSPKQIGDKMNTKTTTSVLSTGEAIALGDLMTGLQQKLKIEWLGEDGEIRKGELRSLVRGPGNFDFLQWGTDVRDGYVWITANGMEHTESVRHLVTMLQEG